MEHIKFTKINQFRQTVTEMGRAVQHGNHLDVITFKGRPKIHGSNGSVVLYTDGTPFVYQSRNRILEIGNDNLGFAFEMTKHEAFWEDMRGILIRGYMEIFVQDRVASFTVYGEWCGGNIQKGVAIRECTKRFIVFAIKATHESGEAHYLTGLSDNEEYRNIFTVPGPVDSPIPIYNIQDFKSWVIMLDIHRPSMVVDLLQEITTQVEDECPVAKVFGHSGIGEGVVWTGRIQELLGPGAYHEPCTYIYRFKTKGEKHSVSKVAKMPKVQLTAEEYETRHQFAEAVLTERRLEQGIEYLEEMNLPVQMSSFGTFIKWVMKDVIAEEMDTMVASNIDGKLLGKILPKEIRKWFMGKYA